MIVMVLLSLATAAFKSALIASSAASLSAFSAAILAFSANSLAFLLSSQFFLSSVNAALSGFNKEEKMLIAEKFFKRPYGIKEKYSQRHYFRKQKNIFDKIVLKFEEMGVNADWFEKNCSDIYFLNAKYLTIKKLAKTKRKNSKTIKNI